MKRLVITVQTDGASAAERGVVFRHIEKLGGMGGFCEKKHDANVMGMADIITWSDGNVMQSGQCPEELTITVSGPSGSGKTVFVDRIAALLAQAGVHFTSNMTSTHSESIAVVSGQVGKLTKVGQTPVSLGALDLKVDAADAIAAVDAVDVALSVLELPYDNITTDLRDTANTVLIKAMAPVVNIVPGVV